MLHDVFDLFGPICSLQVFRSRNNFCHGYALVTFEHHNDAKNALESLDFSEVLDKLPMRVSWVDHLSFMILGRHEELCEAISYFGQFLTCRVHKNNSFGLDDPKESSSHAQTSVLASDLMTRVSEEELLKSNGFIGRKCYTLQKMLFLHFFVLFPGQISNLQIKSFFFQKKISQKSK